MSTPRKRKLESNSNGTPSKKHKWLSLSEKLDIIKSHENGASFAKISRDKSMAESTVRNIVKAKNELRKQSVNSPITNKMNVAFRNRSRIIDKMEHLLYIWLEDNIQNNVPLSKFSIQAEARNIYERLKCEMCDKTFAEENETFSASNGWFERFKARVGLHNVQINGEASSADTQAAKTYPIQLEKLINDGGYTEAQIFNFDETGLVWKKMPTRTYLTGNQSAMKGRKKAKDRFTLLLGGNATGDFRMKPLLIYQSENPRALKNVVKDTLPVIWKSSKKAWMTKFIFKEWFTKYLCPAIERYLKQKNLSQKALILLDNAPSHPDDLKELHPHFKVEFLPANTTSILQPMDQGVISTFKKLYMKKCMIELMEATKDHKNTVEEFWKSYNVKNALDNVAKSWNEVTTRNLRAVWKNLLVNRSITIEDEIASVGDQTLENDLVSDIVKLGQSLGFTDLDSANVLECLEEKPHFDIDDLIAIDELEVNANKEDSDDDEPLELESQKDFTKEQLVSMRL